MKADALKRSDVGADRPGLGEGREVLTPAEMQHCDQLTAETGGCSEHSLLLRAGSEVAALCLARYPEAVGFDVLCGPGNNGGDGYVAASHLAAAGCAVTVWREMAPAAGSAAELCADAWSAQVERLSDFEPKTGHIIVDALYGAGLTRPLGGSAAAVADQCRIASACVVAVDLPSGVSGLIGRADGSAFQAALTITFVRSKPGHWLFPGRSLCGELVVADIGTPDRVVASVGSRCRVNDPAVWKAHLPRPAFDTHKYARGHAVAFSGGAGKTGAARLSAMAAARAGAGAVTVLSPTGAMGENAAHLTSIMLAEAPGPDDISSFVSERKAAACIIGPGYGPDAKEPVLALIAAAAKSELLHGGVLDADAITAFKPDPPELFAATAVMPGTFVLTPHEGEFGRLFPDLAEDAGISKLEKARRAAERSHCVVVYKGSDTVVAAPDGLAVINPNGTPLLATAGSGDVLAGLIGGLIAQGMAAFDAACAGVWMHAQAARLFGSGLIAEDLPGMIPQVLAELQGDA